MSPAVNQSVPAPPAAAVEFHYTQTESFVELLLQLGGLDPGQHLPGQQAARRPGAARWHLDAGAHLRAADGPGRGRQPRLAIGTRSQVWLLPRRPDLASRLEPVGTHDGCFLPRSCHVTGDIGVHELAWAGDELWMVNTRFSCLCTLAPDLQLRAAVADHAFISKLNGRGPLPPEWTGRRRWQAALMPLHSARRMKRTAGGPASRPQRHRHGRAVRRGNGMPGCACRTRRAWHGDKLWSAGIRDRRTARP